MGLALEAAQQAAFGGDPRSDSECPDFKALKEVEQKISAAAEEGIQQAGGGGTTSSSSSSSGASGNGVSSASSQASSASASAAPTAVLKEGPLGFFTKAGKRDNRFFQLVHAPSASAGGTQLTLVAFKADPNPQRTQPPPVGATESASAR